MNFFLIKGFMTELLNTTGKRVERLRKDRHWTQKQLSAAADVRQSYISGIENDTASPSAEIMARVAKALGTSLDFLVMISDNPVVKEDSEPEFFSPEADEAARIIDGIKSQEWRVVMLDAVKRTAAEWAAIQRQDREWSIMLDQIEAAGGGVARAIAEDFLRTRLSSPRRSSSAGMFNEVSGKSAEVSR